MKQLQQLGWEWRQNGVILSVRVDGQNMQVFVPLARVFLHFDEQLAGVGCPFEGVGEPMSVGGFFSWVKKAASSVAAKVVPKAIQRAAANVVSTAKRYGAHALSAAKAIGTNKYFRMGLTAAAFAVPALAPAAAALEIANRVKSYYAIGVNAAKQIQAGVHTAQNAALVARGLASKNAVAQIIAQAQRGDPRAKQLIGAFQHLGR